MWKNKKNKANEHDGHGEMANTTNSAGDKLTNAKNITHDKRKNKIDLIIKIIILVLTVLFLVLSVIAEFSSKKQGGMPKRPSKEMQQEANRITVGVKEIKPETIQSTVKVTGNVSSVSEINIYPDTSGKITMIQKHLGDYVAKGEIIAYIDPSKPGSAYIASPVIATVGGTVIDLPVSQGDTVSNSTSIATVGSLKNLRIKIYVAEKYSGYLKEGLKAYVSLTSINDENFLAKVVKVSPVVNKANRTIETELHFLNYDKRIKPGMFATVNLVILEEENTAVIPKKAIHNFNGKDTVLVVAGENKIAERREVVTGLENDLEVQIKSGIDNGDKVIIEGSATEGSLVKIAGEK